MYLFGTLLLSGLAESAKTPCPADNTNSIVLWPDGPPNEKSSQMKESCSTDKEAAGCGPNRDGTCNQVENVSIPTLTPFIVNNGTGAAVIIAPGGGYSILAWNLEGVDVAAMYNSLGVSAFVLKYRVPARPPIQGLPHWWAPLQDAQRAVGYVRANAHRWNLNSSRIGFSGFSAGGHLTAHMSTAWRQRVYARIDAADDVSCRPDFSIFLYPWALFENNIVPEWGASYNLSADFPDATFVDHPISFFAQAEDDPVAPVEGTLAYYGKVKSVANRVNKAAWSSLHVYPTGGHGFGLCQQFCNSKGCKYQETCGWPSAVFSFLQDHGLAKGWPSPFPTHAESAVVV
jgi:acetyl esterase/lipase